MENFINAVLLILLSCVLTGIYFRDVKYKSLIIPKYSAGDFVCWNKKVYEIDEVRIVQKRNKYFPEPDDFYACYLFVQGGYVNEKDISSQLSPQEYAIYNTVLKQYADITKENS